VTALCGLSIPLGNLVAFIMSWLIYGNASSNEEYISATVNMVWVQNIWITLVCMPYMLLIKTEPYPIGEV
jgi:hypothetical protein